MARTGGQVALGALVAGAAGWLVATAITGGQVPGMSTGVLATLAGGAVVAVVYLATTYAIGSAEARSVVRRR
ncbi:MAG: hypothetical protein F4176_06270 [Acidimicrobiia bacterium]|nr:hypothetical protein [Acidimicrobiia bacterium]